MARRAKGEGSVSYNASRKRWQGSILLSDGRRKYVYGKTKSEASKKLAELREELSNGIDVVGSNSPLPEYIAHWLGEQQPGWSQSTYAVNERLARLHITPCITLALKDITVTVLQNWQRQLRTERGENVALRALQLLRHALTDAVSWRMIEYNAAALVTTPRVQRREGVALTPAQVQQLLQTVANHRLRQLVLVTVRLGLRRGEVLALRWADVDLEKETLVVRKGKTAAATRVLPLSKELVKGFGEHWQRQMVERKSERWQEQGLVFTTVRGGKIHPVSLHRTFKDMLEMAGLPDIHFHDLRHTALTHLGTSGATPAVVQAIAGHATPSLALRVYTHVGLEYLRETVNSVSDSVAGVEEIAL
ncbi:MAG: site-specific integrase [Chloroflexaceae bacterium]|nr:site-specific integrase [Chloroflexaceae bacterium]